MDIVEQPVITDFDVDATVIAQNISETLEPNITIDPLTAATLAYEKLLSSKYKVLFSLPYSFLLYYSYI